MSYQPDIRMTDISLSLLDHIITEGCCPPDSPGPQGVTTVSIVNTPQRKEEEIIKVNVSNMKHIGTDEFETKLKEKEVQLIRMLDEEEHQRYELRSCSISWTSLKQQKDRIRYM